MYKIKGLLFLLLLSFNCLFGSTEKTPGNVSFSTNNRYFAELFVEEDQNNRQKKGELTKLDHTIKVFDFKTNNYIFDTSISISPIHQASIELSPDGSALFFRADPYGLVFNLKQNKLILSCYITLEELTEKQGFDYVAFGDPSDKVIVFTNYDHYFLLRRKKDLAQHSKFDGQLLNMFKGFSSYAQFTKLDFSDQDNYLIGADNTERIYVWETKNFTIKARYRGVKYSFDENTNIFTLHKRTASGHAVYTYTAPDFLAKDRVSAKNVAKLYANNHPSKFSASGNKLISSPIEEVTVKNFSLSPSGKYLLSTATQDRISDINIVLNLSDQTIKETFESPMAKRENSFPYWVSDSIIKIPRYGELDELYFLKGSSHYKYIPIKGSDYERRANKNKDWPGLPNEIQSTDYKYYLSHPAANDPSIAVINRYPFNDTIKLNADFMGFVPQSDNAVLQKSGSAPELVSLHHAFNSANGNLLPINNFNPFPIKKTETAKAFNEFIPEGYKYHRISHISKFSPFDTDLDIVLSRRSISVDGHKISLNVHITDTNGIFYTGLSSDSLKPYWCGLYSETKDGKLTKISDFAITEHNHLNQTPGIMALILDHSGSMGEKRAKALQEGAKAMLQSKRPIDKVALLKYDFSVGIEAYPTTNKTKLLNALQLNGLTGYGGSTSLLDALNTGISLVRKETEFSPKCIIILTDGEENSSMIEKEKVLERAINNNVKIFTVGYGMNSNDSYLEAISKNTGGNFYKIYTSEQLQWVLEDIYNKINNYYQIDFITPHLGKQNIILKFCFGNNENNTLITSIDNSTVNNEKDIKNNITTPTALNPLVFKRIEQLSKVNNDSIKKLYGTNIPKRVIHKEFSYLKFPDIKFFFDKTEIVPGTANGIWEVIRFLKEYDNTRIQIIGHTDSRGSEDYNQKLSVMRAEAIKKIMTDAGIAPDRIGIVGKGEAKPVINNQSEEEMYENRRVEFTLISDDKVYEEIKVYEIGVE